MYLRNVHAALIIYDVSNYDSFRDSEKLLIYVRESAPSETIVVLVGTKLDQNEMREVNLRDGQNFAKKQKIGIFSEVSSKTNENVD